MKMKERLGKFFSMSREGKGGFTLVELIVVIAILAILGGVAIPVYSGYVEKAEWSKDEVLLEEVNRAFVSACIMNGEDYRNRTDSPTLTAGGKCVTGITVTGTNSETLNAQFLNLFGGVDQEFKRMAVGDLIYNATLGEFEWSDCETVQYGNTVLRLSRTDIEAFRNSVFSEMGTEYLLGEMDNVVLYASDYEEKLLSNIKDDDDFKDLCNLFGDYPSGNAATDKNIQMQALVMYTAGKYEGLDADYVYEQIIKTPGEYIADHEDEGRGFAVNAAMYSLALAYAETDEGKAIVDSKGWDADALTVDNIRKLMVNQDGAKDEFGDIIEGTQYNTFEKWLKDNEAEAKTNLDGFGAAMSMLTDNKGNLDTNAILSGGYGVGELAAALGAKLNRTTT